MGVGTRTLVVNVGSSSVKVRALDGDQVEHADDLRIEPGQPGALSRRLGPLLADVDVVAHRIVHGGPGRRGPARVDDALVDELRQLEPLAPLHQRPALDVVDELRSAHPQVPHVACFDTAFHADLPEEAVTWAIPAAWRDLGVRRYGFHGLSHAHVARRAPVLAGRPAEGLRIVSCHLGSGASLAAIADGRSIDTTMGMTPMDGLVMATRTGAFDPGALLWLQAEHGLTLAELTDGLDRQGGLLALAGTKDLAEVVQRAGHGDERCGLAVAVWLRSVRANLAAMVAPLGGVDVIAFTGGVGEHAPTLRSAVLAGLGFLAVDLDEGANGAARGDARVTTSTSPVAVVVVEAREDLEMARQARSLLP